MTDHPTGNPGDIEPVTARTPPVAGPVTRPTTSRRDSYATHPLDTAALSAVTGSTPSRPVGAVMAEPGPKHTAGDATCVATDRQPAVMSALLVGHRSLAAQRRGRYVSGSAAHHDRMAPDLAATLISAYTRPGALVFDPLAGVGTTLIEAVHAGRDAFGVDCDPGWVALARANIRLARRNHASGRARVVEAEATHLPRAVIRAVRGRVDLVLTAPPSGDTMPGPSEPGSGPTRTSAARPRRRVDVFDGIAAVLTGCADLLTPDGLIIVVTGPQHRDQAHASMGEQIASRVTDRLAVVDHRHAVHAVLRDGRLVAQPHRRRIRPVAVNSTPPAGVLGYDDITMLRRTTADVPGHRR